jgi:hypothetical protein
MIKSGCNKFDASLLAIASKKVQQTASRQTVPTGLAHCWAHLNCNIKLAVGALQYEAGLLLVRKIRGRWILSFFFSLDSCLLGPSRWFYKTKTKRTT